MCAFEYFEMSYSFGLYIYCKIFCDKSLAFEFEYQDFLDMNHHYGRNCLQEFAAQWTNL